jgi:Rrf2 family protein
MNFRKSTRYALYASMEMASARAGVFVTANQVAERYEIPSSVLAKVFQQLVRAGLAVGTRGTRGGYQLARAASQVTVMEVIDAFEPVRSEANCLLADPVDEICVKGEICRLRRLVDEVDELVRCTYSSVTLDTLVGRQASTTVQISQRSDAGAEALP